MGLERTHRIALIGPRGSGKSALCMRLNELGNHFEGRHFVATEYHTVQELRAASYDVILQVVDATDLEANLALTPRLIDAHQPLVIAINRYDLLLATEHWLDYELLSTMIGVPIQVVSTVSGEGVAKVLLDVISTLEREVLHSDEHPIYKGWEQQNEAAYAGYVHGALTQTLHHAPHDKKKTRLEIVDWILTNKWTGFPILALVLFGVFQCTFALGGPIQDWLQECINALYLLIVESLPESWFTSLLGDGIVLGVGTLLTALPNIIILFFFLSLMEDTGYMARIAYLMDGLMHVVGLHGRSAIPLLMGFDCNVPAIIAAKDIIDKKDRTLTMLMVPFMSCSARLPVYILFISIFFEDHKGLVLTSLYLLGILLSFCFAFLLRQTPYFRRPSDEKVNELPDFRLPHWKSILRHIWFRVSDFLKKISTVVLCASVIIWALEFFPAQDLLHIETSWLASIGHFLEPIMAPLGFDWKMSVCLLTGVPAKEAIAATFAILYGGDVASSVFSPLSAYAFLVFTLLYFPCVATVATLRRETNAFWASVSVINSLLIAWLGAFAVFRIGTLILG